MRFRCENPAIPADKHVDTVNAAAPAEAGRGVPGRCLL